MNVRHKKFHRATLSDFPGFVQVALRALGAGARADEKSQPSTGEEGFGEFVLLAGAAEAGHGLFNF